MPASLRLATAWGRCSGGCRPKRIHSRESRSVSTKRELRLRALLRPQLDGTRSLAGENIRQIDSVRQVIARMPAPEDLATLDREAATAADYSQVADVIDHGLDQGIAAHPAFALRDTMRLRGERTRQLIVQTQRAVATGRRRSTTRWRE